VVYGVGGMAAVVGVMWGGPALGLSVTGVSLLMQGGLLWLHRRRPIAHVSVHDEHGGTQRLALAQLHVARASLMWDKDRRWSLEVPYLSRGEHLKYTANGLRHITESVKLTGGEAQRAAAQILPHVNTMVGRARTVQDAVRVLEEAGSTDATFATAARVPARARNWNLVRGKVIAGSLASLPTPMRLALEMAAHENSERRALEGELQLLEAAWKDAEEIAGIADDMFLPESVTNDLARLKRQRDGE